MTQFQVFLPPTDLVPLHDVSKAHLPLLLRTVPRPASFTFRSFSQSLEQPFLGPPLVLPDTTPSGPSRKRKKKDECGDSLDKEDEDALPISQDWAEKGGSPSWVLSGDSGRSGVGGITTRSQGRASGRATEINQPLAIPSPVNPMPAPSSSRRRSHRYNPADLTHILPLPLADDTILSLNTTISLSPSQPSHPALNPAAETSITNFPRWVIPLSKLISLDILLTHPLALSRDGESKLNVIVCITATTPPVVRRKREEKARGVDGSFWVAKWDVVAPAAGIGAGGKRALGTGEVGCEVILWDKCAQDFGDIVRRGDVALLEAVEFKPASRKDKARLVLSPSTPSPRPTILYRTLPRYSTGSDYIRASPRLKQGTKILPEDKAYRPDLRMGRSEPGVRRVSEIAEWFAEWVGGSCTA